MARDPKDDQQLRQLLEQIGEGHRNFHPSSEASEDIALFQKTVQLLEYLHGKQFIQRCNILRESSSGQRSGVVAVVGGLTLEGERLLRELQEPPDPTVSLIQKRNTATGGKPTSVFISHINEEAPLALALKQRIDTAFDGQVKAFVSSDKDDLPAGSRWLETLDQALDSATLLMVLCSQQSLRRPWINFETGCGWVKRVPIIPICHSDLDKTSLPPPLSTFQALDAGDAAFPESLLHAVEKHSGVSRVAHVDFDAFHIAIVEAIKALSNGTRERTSGATPVAAEERTGKAFVPINDVARELYGRGRGTRFSEFVESVCTKNGKLVQQDVLNVCAMYLAHSNVSIFGKHPPSNHWEQIDKAILNGGMFENGAFHRFGDDNPAFRGGPTRSDRFLGVLSGASARG